MVRGAMRQCMRCLNAWAAHLVRDINRLVEPPTLLPVGWAAIPGNVHARNR